jgi:hypothetical protein
MGLRGGKWSILAAWRSERGLLTAGRMRLTWIVCVLAASMGCATSQDDRPGMKDTGGDPGLVITEGSALFTAQSVLDPSVQGFVNFQLRHHENDQIRYTIASSSFEPHVRLLGNRAASGTDDWFDFYGTNGVVTFTLNYQCCDDDTALLQVTSDDNMVRSRQSPPLTPVTSGGFSVSAVADTSSTPIYFPTVYVFSSTSCKPSSCPSSTSIVETCCTTGTPWCSYFRATQATNGIPITDGYPSAMIDTAGVSADTKLLCD